MRPVHTGGRVNYWEVGDLPDIRTPLDRLDEGFRDLQELLTSAIESDDSEAIADIRAEAADARAVDTDGIEWRVHAPNPLGGKVQPYFRFHYRYWGGKPGDDLRPLDRRRFALAPSLAKTYAATLGSKGWLARVIRNAEPLGYVGSGAVGIGLWFLLGDIVGSLPGWFLLAGMMGLAAGLWLSTVRLTSVGYREALRLGHVTRAAAVGVTGAVPWVGTVDATWITNEGRVAVTAFVVTVAAVVSYQRTASVLTYSIALGGWVVALAASSIIVFDEVLTGSLDYFTAHPGILMAIGVAVPILTMRAAMRWIPQSVIALSAVAAITVLVAGSEDGSTVEAFLGVFFGAGVALSVWFSRRYMRAPMRRFHIGGAAAIAGVTVLVALARMPWDFLERFFEWLADIPLPVLLITGGSVLLIAIAWVVRIAVHRVGNEQSES